LRVWAKEPHPLLLLHLRHLVEDRLPDRRSALNRVQGRGGARGKATVESLRTFHSGVSVIFSEPSAA
jgi:hypothetical protein